MEQIQGAATRVALYARVSTEEQREGNTIQSQVAELEKFAETNDWAVQGRYIDEGWSGALLARPELDRLRDDAGRGLFDVVLINDVDRLARDLVHLGVIKRDLERKKIRLVFRKLPASSDPTSNLMVNILGSFAEFERELIADRTRRGMRHKVEVRKQYVGCTAPYGYKYIRKDLSGGVGILEVNPEEAQAVKQMFRWVVEEGLSIQKVADRLTRLKIPTRKGGLIWQGVSVYKILRNETYTGTWSYSKAEACDPKNPRSTNPYRRKRTGRRPRPKSEWVRITLPEELQLITRELWQATQRQIDRNRKFSPRNIKVKYLLQGLGQCEFCAGPMKGVYGKDRYGTYIYYACSRRCGQLRWIPRKDIETVVWEKIKSALLDPAYLESRTAAALKRISNEGQEIAQRQLDLSLKEVESQEAALFREYQTDRITSQQLSIKLERLSGIRQQVLTEAHSLKPAAAEVHERVSAYCNEVKARLQSPSFPTKQLILRRLIKVIITNNEAVRIVGALPLKAESEVVKFPLSRGLPHRREQTCNHGAIEFEIIARLPACRAKSHANAC